MGVSGERPDTFTHTAPSPNFKLLAVRRRTFQKQLSRTSKRRQTRYSSHPSTLFGMRAALNHPKILTPTAIARLVDECRRSHSLHACTIARMIESRCKPLTHRTLLRIIEMRQRLGQEFLRPPAFILQSKAYSRSQGKVRLQSR